MTWKTTFCLWFVRLLSVMFIFQAGAGTFVKFYEGRTDDLVHNALHLLTGLSGVILVLGKEKHLNSQRFAIWFGSFYFGLGLLGWIWSNPFGVLPLRNSDNVFHVIVGLFSLGFGLLANSLTGKRRYFNT